MAKLIYCGPEVAPGTGIPLPEGWPYVPIHDEPDEALAAEKVASGNYRLEAAAATTATPIKAAPKEGE